MFRGCENFRNLFLTFDVEDFINTNSIGTLHSILKMLKIYELRALFFITGHMAEKLSVFPEITALLKFHEVGYHSSAHSVRPTIFEYTDVKNYEEAYSTSLKRETSHIDPITGEVKGKGGIDALKDLFNTKKIIAYRAPGNCWSPPHIEALMDLGIKFDFSADFSPEPVYYKGVTFYPYAVIQHWKGDLSNYKTFLNAFMKHNLLVLGLHPSLIVNRSEWDSIYFKGNPKELLKNQARSFEEAESLLIRLELLLKQIKLLRQMKLLEVTPDLSEAKKNLVVTKILAQKSYENSVKWAKKYFNYEPRFLRYHFLKYFDII